MEIAIIGAGPIGCYTGYLLAKSGHKVSIYENHPQVGAPIQCTGILTSDFDEFGIPLDYFLVNTINKIEVHSSNKSLEIKQKDYIVCRNKFDNFFAEMAKKEGASIFLNHSFTRKERKELVIKDAVGGVEKKIIPEIVIAADGPLSPTAKAYGFYHPERENYFGIQATVHGSFQPHTIKTYFGRDVCPGLFAWITPENKNTARVGLATKKNSKHYFDKFMQKNNFTATAIQAGTIPIYHPQQILQKENCYLVGDASTYVKATTLGGIVPALRQAECLVNCINNPTKKYHREVASVRKKMWLHLKLHHIFDKFSDQDWDKLLTLVAKPKVRHIFEKYTRDNPIPLVGMALMKEPRFLYFLKHLF